MWKPKRRTVAIAVVLTGMWYLTILILGADMIGKQLLIMPAFICILVVAHIYDIEKTIAKNRTG